MWDKIGRPTADITLKTPGISAEHLSLRGEATPYSGFDGQTLRDISLTPGNVEIYRIKP